MAAYLKRLLGALGAYQIASILQKLLAVLLLPVYTGRIAPGGYGIVETLATFVIFVSIVARFGIIESFLRYYFIDEDPARRDALVRRSVLFLVATTTVTCAVLVIPAAPLARLITSEHVPAAFRWSVLGIWSFTNLELAQAVLRVDERLRAYAIVNSINVAVTVAASLVLVIGLNKGYEGLLIANFGTSTVVLFGLWWHLRRRLNLIPAGTAATTAAESFRTLFRFGLPTVPAEASVYALSVLDRQYIVHSQGTYAAGRYAIAMKVAGAIAFIVTAFQYAWPPLAYSVGDDAQAARLYSLVTTYYALITGWVVAGLALEDRFIIRLLTPHPGYFGSYRAIPWVSLGWAMYGLWVVLLVVAGRAKITSRNFPAALVGLVVNVVLLIVLVPRFGIAGGGIALCGAYVAMLGVMHMLIRRAFPVSFEWRRLAQLAVVIGGLAVAGDLLLPTSGLGGFVTRALVFLAIGPVLWVTGFVHRAELDQGLATLRGLRGRIGSA
jgi:O-antigen/teichoic acid export membrane protein